MPNIGISGRVVPPEPLSDVLIISSSDKASISILGVSYLIFIFKSPFSFRAVSLKGQLFFCKKLKFAVTKPSPVGEGVIRELSSMTDEALDN